MMLHSSSQSHLVGGLPGSAAEPQRSNVAAAAAPRIVSLVGAVTYADALRLQYAAQKAVQQQLMPNTLYLLEHAPVITLGRGTAGIDKDFITSRAELEARGITIVEADRGGDTTYHAPGQLVGYSIVDLQKFGRDLHHYLRTLEAVIIQVLSRFGVPAQTVPGLTGVWVGERKIAAIGIKVSRWVSMHGFSINNDLDLTVMRRDIVPCGIADKGVVSLRELGVRVPRQELESALLQDWSTRFGNERSSICAQSTWQNEFWEIAGLIDAPQPGSEIGATIEG